MKGLKAFTLQMAIGANIATIVMMLFVGYADYLNPTAFPMLSNVGLSYPIFLIFNFCFLIFWLVFKRRKAFIPILGFVICYYPTRIYMPLNINRSVPPNAIKVLSYNVWMFSGWDETGKNNPTLQFIAEQNADIVCLQEAEGWGIYKAKADSVMNVLYQYADTSRRKDGGDVLAIYSKYPIIKKERIVYPSKTNHSAAFYLKINGDTVVVINNHFESIGLSPEDKTNFKEMVKGDMNAKCVEKESKKLIDKLAEASKRRAPQVDAVAQYIYEHKGMSMILCGDFNDGPLSYTRRIMAKSLTDCYVESGNGIGISYHHGGFYVRIDNIMCSNDWVPYGCKVDNRVKSSDHYPIYCWLKKRVKP